MSIFTKTMQELINGQRLGLRKNAQGPRHRRQSAAHSGAETLQAMHRKETTTSATGPVMYPSNTIWHHGKPYIGIPYTLSCIWFPMGGVNHIQKI